MLCRCSPDLVDVSRAEVGDKASGPLELGACGVSGVAVVNEALLVEMANQDPIFPASLSHKEFPPKIAKSSQPSPSTQDIYDPAKHYQISVKRIQTGQQ